MAADADLRVHRRRKIVRIGWGAEQINRQILRSIPDLVVDPVFKARPDMARHAGHLFMRRNLPRLVGRLDRMTTCAEVGMIGEGHRDTTEHHCGHHDGQDDGSPWLADHRFGKR